MKTLENKIREILERLAGSIKPGTYYLDSYVELIMKEMEISDQSQEITNLKEQLQRTDKFFQLFEKAQQVQSDLYSIRDY